MRKELKKRNIEKLDVIASDELINKAEKEIVRTPGSVAFVPSVAGIMIAGFVINNLIKQ
jgi:tRNA A37 threonylcarbamoyladenosine dehydratase